MAGFNQLPPEYYMALGGGILSGDNFAQGLGHGFQNASTVLTATREKQEADQQRSATYEALKRIDPDKAELFKSRVLTGPQAFSLFSEEKAKREAASKPSWKWMNIDGKLVRIDENSGTIEQQADYSKAPDPTTIQRDLQAAGLQPGTPEYQRAILEHYRKSGTMVDVSPDGTVRFLQGDISSAPGKMTESQSKDINWLTRGKGANDELSKLDAKLTSLPETTAGKVPVAGNYLKSEDYQMAERAGREFLAVVLRKDSGGAITPDEYATYAPTFLPEPGDGPKVIERKRLARERFLDAMNAGLPEPMQKLVPDPSSAKESPDAAATTTTQPGGKSEYIINGKKATVEQVDE